MQTTRMVEQRVRGKLYALVAKHPHPSRYWYLPFLVVEGGLAFFAITGGMPGGYYYLAVALVFLVQTIRPTILGWYATMAAWFAGEFLEPLHDRLAYDISGYTPAYLIGWGLVPLVWLYLIRPRLKAVPEAHDVKESHPPPSNP